MAFYSSITSRISNALQAWFHRVYVFIDTSTMHYPQFYLGFAIFTALIGYAYLLLFPVLVLAGISNVYESLTSNIINWLTASIWAGIAVAAAFVTYSSTRIKFSPPVGLTLAEDKAPELFKLIKGLAAVYKLPVIHRIVITGDYELNIIKTPKWVLPVWSSNTMVIGLPVLQCHTPDSFSAIVAGRIGQFSKRNNPITNWLYQLRAIWYLYHPALKKNKVIGTEVLSGFFYLFTTLRQGICHRRKAR